MTNIDNIEKFLHRMCRLKGKDPLNPEDKSTIKMQSLLECLKEMAERIGDEKINNMFKSILTSLVIETPEGPIKDSYLETLNEFNKELNIQLN